MASANGNTTEQRFRVAVLDDYTRTAASFAEWGSLADRAEFSFFHDHVEDEDALVERLAPFDGIVADRERTPFPATVLDRLPRLRLLVTTGSVNASIDIEAAHRAGIVVSATRYLVVPPRASVSTAEHTWGLILALAKQLPREDAGVRAGQWQVSVGTILLGKTIGVLGLGRIGARVAHYARAFGAIPIAWSQNLTAERAAECGALLVDKRGLLEQSDFLSVHVNLSERTLGLIGTAELELMKPSAYLVNTARGPIVDEEALVAALREGTIAGAALDVYDHEPLPPAHPFRELGNTILTPHSAYVTKEGYRTFFEDVVEDIKAFLDDEPIRLLTPGASEWEHARLLAPVLIHGRLTFAQTTPKCREIEVVLPLVRSDGDAFTGEVFSEAQFGQIAVSATTVVTDGRVTARFEVPQESDLQAGVWRLTARDDDAQIDKAFILADCYRGGAT